MAAETRRLRSRRKRREAPSMQRRRQPSTPVLGWLYSALENPTPANSSIKTKLWRFSVATAYTDDRIECCFEQHSRRCHSHGLFADRRAQHCGLVLKSGEAKMRSKESNFIKMRGSVRTTAFSRCLRYTHGRRSDEPEHNQQFRPYRMVRSGHYLSISSTASALARRTTRNCSTSVLLLAAIRVDEILAALV